MKAVVHPGRRLPIAVAVVAAAALGAWLLVRMWNDGEAAPAYAVTEARRGDVIANVAATGTLSPRVEVQVGSQVSGRISQLHADYNDEVKAGQVIARLDPRFFESAVDQARARLTAARAALTRAQALADNAQIEYERAVELGERGIIAPTELDAALANKRSADAQVTTARAEITLARASLEQAEINLAYTTITSPIDGVVVSRSVDVGQTVAASLQAPVLFVIAQDLRKMELHTSVAEADVGDIRAGMRVEFTVDAYPDRMFTGEVKQVRYEAVAVSNVITYDAVVLVDNDDLALRPGMTANATFILDERRDVLVVPSRALRYRPAGAERPERDARGERTVWVLRDGAPVAVPVTLGLSDGTSTEIVGGDLAAGDPVITGDGAVGAAPAGSQPQGLRRPRIL